MKNKWLIYTFLLFLIAALGALAYLQYHWVGNLSEVEKERLQTNLDAATKNFTADFEREFQEIRQTFQIQVPNNQVPNNEAEYSFLLEDAYTNWKLQANYPTLIDSVFLFIQEEGIQKTYFFNVSTSELKEISNLSYLEEWREKHIEVTKEDGFRLKRGQNLFLDSPSLMVAPIQIVEVINLDNAQLLQKVSVRFNMNNAYALTLLKLNDEVIKEKIIIDKAKTYFSESFYDQYQLSIVNTKQPDSLYFSSHNTEKIPAPDFIKSLISTSFSSHMIFRANMNSREKGNDTALFSRQNGEPKLEFLSERTDSFSNSEESQNNNTSFSNSMEPSGFDGNAWELWLSFREGSLDAFVNKTRMQNLTVSFGVLLILGISIVLIVIFSLRSKELADQQMLFVAGVSHELRTPITVIRSAAENLSQGVVQNEKRRLEYAQLMLKEGRRLSNMVDQIMEFSGIQSGKKEYQMSEIRLFALIEHIKQEADTFLKEKAMQIEYVNSVDSNKIVYADFEGLSIALMNIIHNAIKFSGDTNLIKFCIQEVKYRAKEAIAFTVQDFGIGIPPDEQKKIFKPFYRGSKPVDEHIKGNGIGLSLVHKIVSAHHGEVSVKSQDNEGSVFKVIIPTANSHG